MISARFLYEWTFLDRLTLCPRKTRYIFHVPSTTESLRSTPTLRPIGMRGLSRLRFVWSRKRAKRLTKWCEHRRFESSRSAIQQVRTPLWQGDGFDCRIICSVREFESYSDTSSWPSCASSRDCTSSGHDGGLGDWLIGTNAIDMRTREAIFNRFACMCIHDKSMIWLSNKLL